MTLNLYIQLPSLTLGILLMVLKCKIWLSTRLNNNGKLYTLLAYLYHWPSYIVVLEILSFQMSKSGIKWKHAADTTKLRRRSHPTSHPYKENPCGRVNRRATQYAQEDKVEGPSVSLQEEDEAGGVPHGVGRPQGSAKPGRPPVQVHYEESQPMHLIIFHMCRWREPTSKSINTASPTPSQHTHT